MGPRSGAIQQGAFRAEALYSGKYAVVILMRSGFLQQREGSASQLSLAGQKHPYRSFSVVSANSANTSARIQNRTITLDSLQPSCSK